MKLLPRIIGSKCVGCRDREGRRGGSRRLGLMAAPLLGEQGSERC